MPTPANATIQTDPMSALYIVTRPLSAMLLAGRRDDVTIPLGALLEINEDADELAEIPTECDCDGEARRGTVDALWLLPDSVILWVMIDVEMFRERARIEREATECIPEDVAERMRIAIEEGDGAWRIGA